jgi:hypothetical protein
MSDRQEYAQFAHRARGRVTNFFQLDDVLASYHQLYKELGNLPDSVSFDFRKVNQDAMDLIHAEMGARDEAAWWSANEANLVAVDPVYDEVCGPAEVMAFDPYGANLINIDLIYNEVCGTPDVIISDPFGTNRVALDLISQVRSLNRTLSSASKDRARSA